MVTLDDIGAASDSLQEMQERFLHQRGWETSCDFPGSIWLWCKEVRGRQIATDIGHAYGMESYEEEVRLSVEEEKQANAQHGIN